MGALIEEQALANLCRVVLSRSVWHTWSSSIREAIVEPLFSKGTEQELRLDGQILARYRQPPILTGYRIRLKDALFSHFFYAAADTGDNAGDGQGGFAVYTGPSTWRAPEERCWTIRLYCEERDEQGCVKGYLVYVLLGCIGEPLALHMKQGEFFTPEYTFVSRPQRGSATLVIERLDKLPAFLEEG